MAVSKSPTQAKPRLEWATHEEPHSPKPRFEWATDTVI
jgi:hypothetical protein